MDGEDIGDEFKGYVFKIKGGQDKQGFSMKQGVLTADRVKLMMAKGTLLHQRSRQPRQSLWRRPPAALETWQRGRRSFVQPQCSGSGGWCCRLDVALPLDIRSVGCSGCNQDASKGACAVVVECGACDGSRGVSVARRCSAGV